MRKNKSPYDLFGIKEVALKRVNGIRKAERTISCYLLPPNHQPVVIHAVHVLLDESLESQLQVAFHSNLAL